MKDDPQAQHSHLCCRNEKSYAGLQEEGKKKEAEKLFRGVKEPFISILFSCNSM